MCIIHICIYIYVYKYLDIDTPLYSLCLRSDLTLKTANLKLWPLDAGKMAPMQPAHNHFPFKKWPQSCGTPLGPQPFPAIFNFPQPPGKKAFFCLVFVAVFLKSFWPHGPNLVLLGFNLKAKNLTTEASRCLLQSYF